MKKAWKKQWSRWLLGAGIVAALSGGAAYAMDDECISCSPCGCSSDGGYILCCDHEAC
jgi:hypothetical protein